MPILYFTNEHAMTLVERQVYSGSPSKSTFTTVTGASGAIYMRVLNEEQAAMNGIQWGQAYSGVMDTSIDVIIGDRITVDSVKYIVKGVANHVHGRPLDYKKVILTKAVV